MHIKTTITALFAALALYAPSSFAALQYSDWKVAGDQQALVDTETGIEWLRLPNTKGLSFHQVKQLANTQFSGWRFPTAAEVEQMMDNYYPYAMNAGQTLYNWSINVPLVQQWITLFGTNYELVNSGAETYQSYAMYYSTSNPATQQIQMAGAYYQHSWTPQNKHSYQSNIYEDFGSVSYWEGYSNATMSVFLVSDGGITYSSIQDPNINAMNPNAPVNNPVTPPDNGNGTGGPIADVPVSGAVGGLLLLLGFLGARRQKQ